MDKYLYVLVEELLLKLNLFESITGFNFLYDNFYCNVLVNVL